MPGGVSMKQIHLSPTYQYNFDEIRAVFGRFIHTVAPLIKMSIPSLEELKMYLGRCFCELKPLLAIAKSFDNVMDLVQEKCTIINVCCLEAIADYYNIKEAIVHITDYKMKVDRFCEEIKSSIYCNKDFMTSQSTLLKYETIEFTIEWTINKRTLCDIQDLLWKAFRDMANRVIVTVIKKGNISIAHMYLSVSQ